MKALKLLLSSFLFFSTFLQSDNYDIKAICFDVETLFETHEMRASNYIGKINALKYKVKTGHLPCKADVFNQLTPIKAQSDQVTCNENLDMPPILSDWLLHAQPLSSLKTIINNYLKSSKLSEIEKTVLSNTVNMMLTPADLVDTQQIISATQSLINSLHKQNYKVYIVGNWAHTAALKKSFAQLFNMCDGAFFSETVKFLKPYQEFYQTVLEQIQIPIQDVVWVEKEKQYINSLKKHGMNVAEFKPKELANNLKKFGVKI